MGIAVTSGVNANIIGQLIANVKAFFEILKRFLNVLKEAFLCSKNPAVSQDTAGSSLSKTPSWPPLPANSATLVCGESAAAQGLGAPPL